MSLIIKDLPDSFDLDSQAMASITGGSRLQGRPSLLGKPLYRPDRIINYPAGVSFMPPARGPAPGRSRMK